ncbi:MAG: 30S ribosomal protein S27e [Candidatus Aenigmarchaeota archaeon]|nr:30S ribosomal protein S27e [Candidatus Aenigmarchaeota archaeon]MCX8190594.1 30S ribosomal protein S27e [Candidatus Aenigmarchaeota archaeon]MDW8160137.1 30S ribosomal protein S27e [Candidatus Aenigmarchaeota archaeon]
MKKNLIDFPRSKFWLVNCKKCKQNQIIFNKASTVVKCLNCGAELAVPTGGKVELKDSKLVRELS